MYIIMTYAQSIEAAGETSPGHWLVPRELKDGSWVLPARVLTDPAHESKWALLSTFPQREVSADEWPTF